MSQSRPSPGPTALSGSGWHLGPQASLRPLVALPGVTYKEVCAQERGLSRWLDRGDGALTAAADLHREPGPGPGRAALQPRNKEREGKQRQGSENGPLT